MAIDRGKLTSNGGKLASDGGKWTVEQFDIQPGYVRSERIQPDITQSYGIVIIRGGGDIATGVIQKFFRSHIRLLVLEETKPSAIRRSVAVCEAVYEGAAVVEDVRCRRITGLSELETCHAQGLVPILVDPAGESIAALKPAAVVDAILAKRNLGTHRAMAPVTIGLGPGFHAGQDVHAVIETMRGHDLGRLILDGSALPDTGLPGEVGGESTRRVVHAPAAGKVRHVCHIGDIVGAGEILCEIAGEAVRAPIPGLLRGLIREGYAATAGLKIADVDPRTDVDWHTISDKARAIGGAVLEAFLYLAEVQNRPIDDTGNS